MPRVTTVKKSRKSPGKCFRCDKTIPKGAGYRWWKFRFGRKVIRCLKCPYPRPSELTRSDKLSRIYEASEAIEEIIAGKRIVNWTTNIDVQNRMRQEIEDYLLGLAERLGIELAFDDVDVVMDKCIDIAKVRLP